ncbi:MAG: hypothetical protein U5L96_15740 [Owenweeksia sp.]|nr:hypothetical protein [Owenweeksia sp.]
MKDSTIKYYSNYTKITFIGIAVLMLLCFFIIKPWNKKQVIDWDISYYYSYLPATFIYGDYNFNEKDSLWTTAHFRFTQLEDGGQTPKMTAGLAVLYSPFFLAAHAYASLSEYYPANGFSTPYQFSILFSALVYALIGLWFFGKWMRYFFSSAVVASCMALLYLGTNIFYLQPF